MSQYKTATIFPLNSFGRCASVQHYCPLDLFTDNANLVTRSDSLAAKETLVTSFLASPCLTMLDYYCFTSFADKGLVRYTRFLSLAYPS
jgi:hypothetical protein